MDNHQYNFITWIMIFGDKKRDLCLSVINLASHVMGGGLLDESAFLTLIRTKWECTPKTERDALFCTWQLRSNHPQIWMSTMSIQSRRLIIRCHLENSLCRYYFFGFFLHLDFWFVNLKNNSRWCPRRSSANRCRNVLWYLSNFIFSFRIGDTRCHRR